MLFDRYLASPSSRLGEGRVADMPFYVGEAADQGDIVKVVDLEFEVKSRSTRFRNYERMHVAGSYRINPQE